MTGTTSGGAAEPGPTLGELLDLEEIDRNLYRNTVVFDEPFALYGGQVAAQALLAAGRTVPADRHPHSLHGYFLRGGNAARPTIFTVFRDRDGRSFSARRVVAVQDGEVIFNMSCSFQVPETGVDVQVDPTPEAGLPEDHPEWIPPRLFSIDGRLPPQPCGGPWPTRFWARCTAPLGDDRLLHSAVLAYLSDCLSGSSPLAGPGWRNPSSLDHAVWFHRPVRMDGWVLLDVVPKTGAGGRAWYTGTIHDADGVLSASLTQESLFRHDGPTRGPAC